MDREIESLYEEARAREAEAEAARSRIHEMEARVGAVRGEKGVLESRVLAGREAVRRIKRTCSSAPFRERS
jgi:hypothetical protein